MRFGVVVFPGTWSDTDTHDAVRVMGYDAGYIWHKERDLSGFDAIILPGGFSYGDYLRCGAIARFSPVMESVTRFANDGGLVLGICNGFQVLCEAGLLPGALMRNAHLQYRCQWVDLRVEHNRSLFTLECSPGQRLHVPISHGEGNYFADTKTLDELEANGQVLFRYCTPEGAVTVDANPNGAARNIAGISNRRGNVVGMMPHPERAVEALLSSIDGQRIFASMARHVERRAMAAR